MPIIPRQLGLASRISEAIQSRLSTASVGDASTSVAVTTTRAPVLSSVATVPTPSPTPQTSVVTQPVASSTSAVVSQTPTVSVITLTTTTSTPLISTTQAVTSSSQIPPSSSSVPSLTLATPAISASGISTASTTSRAAITPSVSATGAAANSGSNAQDSNSMSGGIIALIVVGALLAALLAGAFTFRRVQVYRRAKRRENNYGAGSIPDTAPFPFTNVSETDLKGAQPISGFRQGSIISQNEKPLPSIVPDPYPAPVNANPTFGQPAFGNNGMSGAYPVMGAAASYGYGPNRTASPAPSQVSRMMSPAPPMVAPYVPPGSPAPVNAPYPNTYPQAPPPAPAASLAVPQVSGKKRVIQTFQPSLPDELDIRDGDWVTVLHAYDDGWGLCECNGRRGVVPLECLDLGKPDFRASRRLSSLSAIRQ